MVVQRTGKCRLIAKAIRVGSEEIELRRAVRVDSADVSSTSLGPA